MFLKQVKHPHGRSEVSFPVAGFPEAVCTMLGSADSKSTGLYNAECLNKKIMSFDNMYMENDKHI
jgi:hypothetical protein